MLSKSYFALEMRMILQSISAAKRRVLSSFTGFQIIFQILLLASLCGSGRGDKGCKALQTKGCQMDGHIPPVFSRTLSPSGKRLKSKPSCSVGTTVSKQVLKGEASHFKSQDTFS